MQKKLSKHGYSLIELTIVVGLVSLLAVAVSAIVFSTIVSSSRIKNLVLIRQSGDYAQGQIQTIVRNAKSVSSCDSTNDSLSFIGPDGYTTTISLDTDVARIASVSAAYAGYLTPADLEIPSFNITCSPNDSAPELVYLDFSIKKANNDGARSSEDPVLSFKSAIQFRNN